MARFWAEALGWHADGTAARSAVPGVPDLLFTASQRPKTTKNRLHLDLDHAPDGDVDTEAARLIVLGAQHTDIGQGTVPWRVLADPEGNEFCVLPRPPLPHAGPPRESGVGRLAQICLDAAEQNRQETFWAAATGWTFAVRDACGGTPVRPRRHRTHAGDGTAGGTRKRGRTDWAWSCQRRTARSRIRYGARGIRRNARGGHARGRWC
ncbi:VOC family protein [Yinghuangia aomiensis]